MNKRTRTFLIVIALLVITDCYAGVADGLDKIMNPSEPAVQEPKVKPKPPHPAHKESNTAIAPQSKDANCIAGDCINGYGTFTNSNGNKYVGEFKDGRFNGQGTRTNSHGEYVGEFKNGRFNGQGTFTNLNGNKYVGEWKDNKFNGQGTLTYGDGTIKSGLWVNDEFVQ